MVQPSYPGSGPEGVSRGTAAQWRGTAPSQDRLDTVTIACLNAVP